MADSKKRCLYEILNLPRDCSQEEIRSAYRRLALQLHPDKNPNSSPAAFQELQHAYEVLSDPKERQFYDSHRSQILFSNANSSSSGSPSSFFDLDLFSYFSTSAFSGFGDTGKGFFKVYGEVFGKIYAQELFFVKELGLDPDLVRPAPLIGNLESPYSQVTAFYNYWLGFCTVLDFGWVDEYDVALGPNRRSRRAMEEENKKKRKKARREYTDLVRDLAAFVKKRDKRVMDMQLKKSLEEEKRREEEKKRKKEEERKKMERARMYEEPEWAKIDGEEDRVFEEVAIDEDDNKGKKEEFYCVVCNKKFKSDKQWKNHEQSKKHRDKVAELRISFQKEEEEEDEYFESLDDCETEKQDDVNVVDDLCEEFEEDVGLEERMVEDRGHDGDELGSDDETSILDAMVSGHKNRKRSNVIHDDLTTDRGSYKSNGEESSLDSDTGKGQRNQAASEGIDITAYAEYRGETTDSKDNVAGVEIRESSLDSDTGKGQRNQAASEGIDITANAEYRRETTDNKDNEAGVENREENAKELDEDASQSRDKHVREHEEIHFTSSEGVFAKGKGDQAAGKKHKKQQVDARGTVKKETNTTKSSSKGKKQKGGTKAPSNSCETCGQSFDTRNKLFAHLGDTGHAILKSR